MVLGLWLISGFILGGIYLRYNNFINDTYGNVPDCYPFTNVRVVPRSISFISVEEIILWSISSVFGPMWIIGYLWWGFEVLGIKLDKYNL